MSRAQYRPSKRMVAYLRSVRTQAKLLSTELNVNPERVEICRQAGLTPSQTVATIAREVRV